MQTTRTTRFLAWMLIAALVNPGFSTSALARDTDIYVNLNTSGVSPPNVLLVLDTSDSMNTPDDWREYPGAYDSHVEYLWNNTSVISAFPGSPIYAENTSIISLGTVNVTSITYSGTTATVTAASHGLSAGWTVTIGNATDTVYNGQFTVTSVIDANTFTYSLSATPTANAVAQPILANGKAVTSLTLSSTTATATVTAHGFSTGASVIVENASDMKYNGTFVITVTGANTFTYTVSGAPASPATALSMYAMGRNPDATSKYGFWGGKTLAEKRALWQAAYAYATGTEAGDPGARSTYRNFDSANRIFWLPAGTAESDARLRSVSFNQFVGGVAQVGGLRGGISWTNDDYRTYNRCDASFASLLPATVFAPTSYPLNSGKYLGQRWMRWERFLNLATVNLAAYPGATASGNSSLNAGTFRTGYVGWPGDNTPPGGSPGDPTLAIPARDNTNGGTTGDQGQPIRIYQAASYSGWTDVKADGGGYRLQSLVNGNSDTVLATLRSIYGYPLILSNEKFSAWIGNRDGTPAFGLDTGTPAYFDSSTTTSPYTTLGTCNAATGPATSFCRAFTSGAVGATCSRTYKTRTCVISGTNTLHYDAKDQSRYYGATCTQSGVITTSNTGPGPYPAAPAADPNPCAFSSNPADFYSLDNNSCAFRGTTVVEGSSPPLYTASQCQGYARPVNSPDTGHPVPGALTTSACTPGGASGGYYTTCSDAADTNQTCASRFGGSCNNNSCSNQSNYTESCVGGAAGTTAYYRTYNRQDKDDYLYHDCVADNGTAGNPGNGYMKAAGVAWNTAFNTNSAGATASYTTSAASGVGADATKNIDLYSVNYLNWKFGPKGPNGHPIGRKTRIQIAKDALSTLVGKTNGIRLGLEVFNKTANAAGSFKAEGGNIAKKIKSMGARNCGITSVTGDIAAGSEVLTLTSNPGIQVDDVITIAGAGAAGVALTATVLGLKLSGSSSYYVNVDTAASTTVAAATVTLPACSGTSADAYNPALPDFCPLTDPGCARNTDWAQYNNRSGLIAAINAVVAASRTPLTESLYEAYLYFAGKAPKFGTSTLTAQAGGTVSAGYDAAAICSAAGTSCPEGAGKYESPMLTSLDPTTNAPGLCQKNHLILITDGGPEDDYSTNADIKALSYLDPLSGNIVSPVTTVDTTQADTTSGQFESGGSPFGPQDGDVTGATVDGGYIWLDELAYYMSRADVMRLLSGGVEVLPGSQTVSTHTIGFAGANTPVLKSAAGLGLGSNFEANDSASLSSALEQALAKIFFFSPQGSAATVPISALNRSENADDVYLAFFAPDASSTWNGTVKKYKLGAGSSVCGFADPPDNTKPIELCLTGRTELTGTVKNIEFSQIDPLSKKANVVVNPNAVSYWSDEVDGAFGDKGGTGLQLVENVSPAGDDLKPYTRKIYTFITDPGAAAEPVSTSTDLSHVSNKMAETNSLITKTRLGNASMTNANRAKLINYVRGGNPSDSACTDSSSATNCVAWRKAGTRDWGHADVVHSKPAVFTYDPSTSPLSQYVFYLSSDGLLHAVAGYPDDPNSGGGKEKWAFMVEEAMPLVTAMIADSPGTHIEVADGSPVVFFRDVNGNGKVDGSEKVYLFFGLRRGGRAYYAFDITNIDAPQFMWKITPTQVCVGTSCTATTAFGEMGDTWSAPSVGRIRAITNPAIFVGGGYDTNQDYASSFPPTADTRGRAMYVIDAVTATLVKAFQNGGSKMVSGGAISGMDYSIPSDVAALNTDLDGEGLIDRAYVGDSGGQVWRFDVNSPDPGEWTARIIATLSGTALASPFPDDTATFTRTPGLKRKFMYPPVVVKQQIEFTDSGGTAVKDRYDGVYIGTGDRENPNFGTSDDAMFMIKDYDIGLTASNTAPSTIGNMMNIYDLGISCSGSPETCSQTITNTDKELLKTKQGWYYPLKNGEKVTASPTVFQNVLRFATFSPNESLDSCLPAGRGALYVMGAQFGELVNALTSSATLPIARQYTGFSVRGFIPTGTVLIRDKNIYVVHIAEGRLLYQKIGTVGGATKIYWYREQAR